MDNFSRLRERSQPANHNQDQAGSPDEESGQRRLDDFGFKRLRVQFVGDVHEHDDGFVMPREDRAVCVFVFTVAKKRREWMSGCAKFVGNSGVQASDGASWHSWIWSLRGPQERCFLRLDVETLVQLLILEVLCPRAQWIMPRRFPQRKSIIVWFRKVCCHERRFWCHWHKMSNSVCAHRLRQRRWSCSLQMEGMKSSMAGGDVFNTCYRSWWQHQDSMLCMTEEPTSWT